MANNSSRSDEPKNYIVIHLLTEHAGDWRQYVRPALSRNMWVVDVACVLEELEYAVESGNSSGLSHYFRTVVTAQEEDVDDLRSYLAEREAELDIVYDVFEDGQPLQDPVEHAPYVRRSPRAVLGMR